MIRKGNLKPPHKEIDLGERPHQSNCVFGDCYSVDKMGHLFKLADEYDVQCVLDLCIKCPQDVPKSEGNVVKIFYLATDT